MGALYSTQIVNHVYVGATNVVVYTVPTSTTAIVTNIDAVVFNNAAGQASSVGVGHVSLLLHTSTAAETLSQQWAGKVVLNPGDQVSVHCAGSAMQVQVTAYVLPTT